VQVQFLQPSCCKFLKQCCESYTEKQHETIDEEVNHWTRFLRICRHPYLLLISHLSRQALSIINLFFHLLLRLFPALSFVLNSDFAFKKKVCFFNSGLALKKMRWCILVSSILDSLLENEIYACHTPVRQSLA